MSKRTASVSFDQAAGYYDQTRDLPEPLASGGMQLLLDQLQGPAGPRARLLEVGTGTGRIALPLAARGANLFGCDLSVKMMERQRAKWPAARLAQADALALPYGAAAFDGVLTIHVLHLVADWRAALREIRRVLRSVGAVVNSWNPHTGQDVDEELRQFWRGRVDAHGGDWRRPGVQSREELRAEMEQMGAQVTAINAARTVTPVTPQSVIDSLEQRIYSETWPVAEAVFQPALAELKMWAAKKYGNLEQAVPVERMFTLEVARFG
jgi:ubiquinone/menaquinone biosynthesis C-methylase UbiE